MCFQAMAEANTHRLRGGQEPRLDPPMMPLPMQRGMPRPGEPYDAPPEPNWAATYHPLPVSVGDLSPERLRQRPPVVRNDIIRIAGTGSSHGYKL